MQAVESGYVEIDITNTTGEVTLPIRWTGDFQAPDRYHLAIELSGIKLFETIVIGADSYVKDLITGKWETRNELLTPFSNLFAYGAFNTTFGPDVVAGFTLVGVVQLEDEPVYHVRGPVTGNALADLLNDSPVQGRDGEVDYWIGIEDFSVRKIAIRSESPVGPGGATSVTQVAMTISDLGKPVDIMAPIP